jgi:hypothetical protein
MVSRHRARLLCAYVYWLMHTRLVASCHSMFSPRPRAARSWDGPLALSVVLAAFVADAVTTAVGWSL